MSQESKQKLAEVLQELKSEYLLKFPIKISIIRQLTTQKKWTELEEEYHKLKGSGKTYGYPDISVVGEKLEFLLLQIPPESPEIFEQAVQLFEKMHQSYLKGEIFSLEKDPFARTLLALKVK